MKVTKIGIWRVCIGGQIPTMTYMREAPPTIVIELCPGGTSWSKGEIAFPVYETPKFSYIPEDASLPEPSVRMRMIRI